MICKHLTLSNLCIPHIAIKQHDNPILLPSKEMIIIQVPQFRNKSHDGKIQCVETNPSHHPKSGFLIKSEDVQITIRFSD